MLLSSVTATQVLDETAIVGGTGEKPQSKVWEHDHTWWSAFSNSDGAQVFRLDGTSWTPVLNLSGKTGVEADVVVDGDLAHILLERDSGTELASIEYVPGANGLPGTYQLWSVRPQLVPLPSAGTETATIAVDTTGRLWLGRDNDDRIEVLRAAAPYDVWSSPVTIAEGIDPDDISSVVAFDGKIGVFWSNQVTERFGFRVHVDGDPLLVWSDDELPGASSALDVGQGLADDHVNLAAHSDGRLYAAVKTGYDTSGFTQLGLLVRETDGTWSVLHEVDGQGTRPIVQLNELHDSLLVFYRSSDSAGPIVYRESTLSNISFGPRTALIDGTGVNNPSSTKSSATDELVVIAADSANGVLKSSRLFFGVPQNTAPLVDAGVDTTIVLGQAATLDGTVNDDGLPDPPAAVTTAWSVLSGPGTVTFADAASVDTTATFDVVGDYLLQLAADDGEMVSADTVVVSVLSNEEVFTATFRDGENDYDGTRDTRIRVDLPDRNFGSSNTLEVDGNPDFSTLLAWDLSLLPPGSQVVEAAITLSVVNTSTAHFELYEVLKPWVESQATFNLAATDLPWQVAGASGTDDRAGTVLGSLTSPALG
ncbi:MAG: DNRLRE domain-containing protein, partial [Planctomycetes bacterium]|nr:DNRLRE domain-containing protein [Planctomycetota bacterium]